MSFWGALGFENPLFKKGDRGADVSLLQANLNAAGYSTGGVDGIFGSNTERAVKGLQATYGWSQDGKVWQKEFDRLTELVGLNPSVPQISPSNTFAKTPPPLTAGPAPVDMKKWLLIGGAALVAVGIWVSMDGAPRGAYAGRRRRRS